MTGTAGEVADALVEDLHSIADVSTKRMFGGVGIFTEGTMFVIVDSEGQVFLRADESTIPRFAAAGGDKHGRMPYWSVPAAVLSDADEFANWSEEAAEVARRASR
ncbi:MAG: TfoX/Sxy family protein [Acidimicrobiia bacterium]|nr:TfoX/Sxy family protein [Acidimicrobiia bacterium]